MTFRRDLAWTLIIQGVGAGAVLASVLLIGSTLGPASQGLFSRIKTELEFVSALSMFGMPQAAFYYLRKGQMSMSRASWLTLWLGAVAWLIAIVYAYATHVVGTADGLLFATAAASVVVHGMLRVLVLARSTTRHFNVVTLIPQILVFVFAVAMVLHGNVVTWKVSVAYMLAFGSGSVLAWRMIGPEPLDVSDDGLRIKALLSYGLSAWLVAALTSLISVVCLRSIESLQGLSAVGVFALGLTAVQVVLTPFAYAAPLLFRRWVGTDSKVSMKPALLAGLGILVLVTVPALVFDRGLDGISLGGYAALRGLAWFFAVAAAAEVVVRIAAVAANAGGVPWLPATAELARFMLIGTLVFFGSVGTLAGMATIWASAAVVAALTLIVGVHLVPQAGTKQVRQ